MLTLLLALVTVVAGEADAAAGPVPVRTCEQRIEAGDAPLRFPARGSGAVLAGPLALAGHFPPTRAGLGPRHENGRFSVKVGALLRAGSPVVLSVPVRYRNRLFLHYARRGAGGPVVRLEPCPPSTPAFSYDGRVGAVTGFSGGFDVTRPGCYPLDVRVVGERSHRVRLPLGRRCR